MADYGITSFGAYIPRLRLARAAIASAHRWMAPSLEGLAKGSRAFCSWDEDAITMAVEAARDCVPRGERTGVARLTLASTTLPYADLQNSAIVAGALDLPSSAPTTDVAGTQRAGISALSAALRSGAGTAEAHLVVAADRLVAKPASTQEMVYGAGAAAFLLGGGAKILARFLGAGVHTAQFIDHFRPAGSDHGSTAD